jgi:hypothetical protein
MQRGLDFTNPFDLSSCIQTVIIYCNLIISFCTYGPYLAEIYLNGTARLRLSQDAEIQHQKCCIILRNCCHHILRFEDSKS